MAINNQYNEFLDIDRDFSGTVDGRELETSLRRRGFNFSPDIFQFVIYEMSRRTGIQGINFDLYVRVTARFEFLRDQYQRNPSYQNMPLEQYIKANFF
jgi:Ca2+-binding EF-hand superfamily protein